MNRFKPRGIALLWALAPVAAIVAPIAPAALAQGDQFSEGTYILQGGSYSIEVRRQGDGLVVVEPNKTSPYARQADGTYHFYNPNTSTNYGIRVIDNQTIEAFKPDQPGNVPTRLVRLGGAPAAPAPAPAAPAPSPAPVRAPAPAAGTIDSEGVAAMARRYQLLAQKDPDNVQAWTACAAAAQKRAASTAAEADAYGAQMAQVLKLIVVDPSRSPCEDAISSSIWNGEGGDLSASADAAGAAPVVREALDEEQRQRLQALNERADARAEAARAAAVRLAEEQRAYEQRMAEVAAAEAKFARDQAAHEAEVRKAEAAAAEYQRALEEHRRLLASGNYSVPD